MNKFISTKLQYDTIDIFHVRRSIYKAILENMTNFHGTFLDIGCGQMPYRSSIQPNVEEYIGLDLNNNYNIVKPDMYWDGKRIPLADSTVDSAMATEVLEHVPDIDSFLSEVKRVLKPGGVLFFTVPFLWPLHDVPYDEFRYTPFSLKKAFERHCYGNVEIKSLGGWNASMAQMAGLWIKRSAIPSLIRKLLYILFLPFYKLLLTTDKPDNNFSESSMITGLYGLAQNK